MKIRILVALAAMLAAVLGVQGTAQAEYGHGDSVRYASAKGCVKKNGAVPCGTWRLVTHHGRVILLKDAQLRALDAKGNPMIGMTAPVAVSGNGQKIAYFRKDGRLAVRTLNGKVRLLPKNTLPSKTAQHHVTLQLSDDGVVLAVTAARTKLFDTASSTRLGQLPKGRYFVGFSGDGKKVLTSSGADDSLRVYDLSGRLLRQGKTPQLITDNGPYGLHADGKTIAVLVANRKVALYDLESGQVTGDQPIKLPKDGTAQALDWTGGTQVTLHVSQESGSAPTRMTVLQHDVTSGATTVRDKYKLLKDTFVYASCGG
ncbi:hypothetical protein GCM10009555_103680 [Acrocarpospora macrocephala]|uniref:Lipoprotein n=1 Tax=Acrocarpospora macrocephala TaxID=150177 RepID=A0A5M3X540_9ACTN|nr:WD40 repeat domain-containing protein [Acrocarpospora macrocephala]GES15746.1 hypothetical protein Amac_093440 [Acrocarpospora macrocephala]